MRGTLLNTGTVIVGALVGVGLSGVLPQAYGEAVRDVIGVSTAALGVRMFLKTKSPVVPIGAALLGILLGRLMGIESALGLLGDRFRDLFAGSSHSTFKEGFVTTSLLFCVGPMTILGCIEDGLEGKSHLLLVKSVFDGVSALFYAAALGWGVLLSGLTVLVVQGGITLSARPLSRATSGEGRLEEMTACGGLMLCALGLRILGVKAVPVGDMLPGVVIAPAVAAIMVKRGWYE